MSAQGEGAPRLRVLVLNCEPAQCSIYESGVMFWNALSGADGLDLDYVEIASFHDIPRSGFDVYLFNYHHSTLHWLDTRRLAELPGTKLTFVLEMTATDPFAFCPRDAFAGYLVPDPTHRNADPRVFAIPRPLEPAPELPAFVAPPVPWIGSFGFATPGKGFETVVTAVGEEFERAVVRINIPIATSADPTGALAREYGARCQALARPGIEVRITHDYLDKPQLIRWCAENTLNVFLYDRNQTGLAATTDQAIASGRPLAVSRCDTFRHVHEHLRPFPEVSLREAIASSAAAVARMQRLWSAQGFRAAVLRVFESLGLAPAPRPTPRRLLFVSETGDRTARAVFARLRAHYGPEIAAGTARSAAALAALARERAAGSVLWHSRSPLPEAARGALVAEATTLPVLVLDAERLKDIPGRRHTAGPCAAKAAPAFAAAGRSRARVLVLRTPLRERSHVAPTLLARLAEFTFVSHTVSSAAEVQAALCTTTPDLVLVEYAWQEMPWLDATTFADAPVGVVSVTDDAAGLDASDGELFDQVLAADLVARADAAALAALDSALREARVAAKERQLWELGESA